MKTKTVAKFGCFYFTQFWLKWKRWHWGSAGTFISTHPLWMIGNGSWQRWLVMRIIPVNKSLHSLQTLILFEDEMILKSADSMIVWLFFGFLLLSQWNVLVVVAFYFFMFMEAQKAACPLPLNLDAVWQWHLMFPMAALITKHIHLLRLVLLL